jgi:hypothetical protein
VNGRVTVRRDDERFHDGADVEPVQDSPAPSDSRTTDPRLMRGGTFHEPGPDQPSVLTRPLRPARSTSGQATHRSIQTTGNHAQPLTQGPFSLQNHTTSISCFSDSAHYLMHAYTLSGQVDPSFRSLQRGAGTGACQGPTRLPGLPMPSKPFPFDNPQGEPFARKRTRPQGLPWPHGRVRGHYDRGSRVEAVRSRIRAAAGRAGPAAAG